MTARASHAHTRRIRITHRYQQYTRHNDKNGRLDMGFATHTATTWLEGRGDDEGGHIYVPQVPKCLLIVQHKPLNAYHRVKILMHARQLGTEDWGDS